MNTYYHYNAAAHQHVRYYYDRSITSWTWYAVTAPNEDGDQMGYAEYSHGKPSADIMDCVNTDYI